MATAQTATIETTGGSRYAEIRPDEAMAECMEAMEQAMAAIPAPKAGDICPGCKSGRLDWSYDGLYLECDAAPSEFCFWSVKGDRYAN